MIDPVSDDLTIPIKPPVEREQADDDLRRVAQRGVEQAPERRPEVLGQGLGRITHQPGQRNDRDGRNGEQQDRVDADPVENDRNRNEDEQPVQVQGIARSRSNPGVWAVKSRSETVARRPNDRSQDSLEAAKVHQSGICGSRGSPTAVTVQGTRRPTRPHLPCRRSPSAASAPRCSRRMRLISRVTSGVSCEE